MAGDEGRVAARDRARLPLRAPERRETNRHQRRLGVGRQGQVLDRALPKMMVESFCAERVIDFVEHRFGLGKSIGESPAHADRLAALTGKYECALHDGRPVQLIEAGLASGAGGVKITAGFETGSRPPLRAAPAMFVDASTGVVAAGISLRELRETGDECCDPPCQADHDEEKPSCCHEPLLG